MITKDRNLRTGAAVWTEYTKPRIAFSSLQKNIQTEILIVGAGISGAMIAEEMSSRGYDVVVVDKRKPVSGSTAASTALLQYELDMPLTKLSKKIGQDKAIAAWRRSKLGVESLAAKIRDLDIKCDFVRRNSLYLSGNVLSGPNLEEEGQMRSSIGLNTRLVSSVELKGQGINGEAALLSWDNLAVNPVQLTSGFLKVAIENSAQIYSPVEIDTIKHKGKFVFAQTTEGFTIKARHVVFATGYEVPKYIKTRKHKMTSTWAISTYPVESLPDDLPILWEAADPYFYGRITTDKRMIFGGEDAEFSNEARRDALIPKKQQALLRKLRKLLPDHDFDIEHSWAGTFGESKASTPMIGKIPHHKNCYAVMAYGGNGITFSRIAAEIIAAYIEGYKDPEMDLFGF